MKNNKIIFGGLAAAFGFLLLKKPKVQGIGSVEDLIHDVFVYLTNTQIFYKKDLIPFFNKLKRKTNKSFAANSADWERMVYKGLIYVDSRFVDVSKLNRQSISRLARMLADFFIEDYE